MELGNERDPQNDFALKKIIKFIPAALLTTELIEENKLFLVAKKETCVVRKEDRFNNPPVTPLYTEIFFEIQEAKITEQHQTILNKIINELNNYEDFKIVISGHADGMGEASSNEKLSMRRAKAVQFYFMENRILGEKIEIAAYGEARPTLSNNSESGRKHNRRTDITVYYQLNKTTQKVDIEKTPIHNLYKQLHVLI